jgi:hypothetical protein
MCPLTCQTMKSKLFSNHMVRSSLASPRRTSKFQDNSVSFAMKILKTRCTDPKPSMPPVKISWIRTWVMVQMESQ